MEVVMTSKEIREQITIYLPVLKELKKQLKIKTNEEAKDDVTIREVKENEVAGFYRFLYLEIDEIIKFLKRW